VSHLGASAARLRRGWVVFAHDLLWVPAALYGAFWLRFDFRPLPPRVLEMCTLATLVALPIHAVVFWAYGCYRGIWRFASVPDLLRLGRAVVTALALTGLVLFVLTRLEGIPRSVALLYPLLLFTGTAGARVLYRLAKDHARGSSSARRQRALLVGTGRHAEALIRYLRTGGPMMPVGLVDDAPHRQGTEIQGVRVLGTLAAIPRLVSALDVQVVLIAAPDLAPATLEQVLFRANAAGVGCRIVAVPDPTAPGGESRPLLRRLRVEDLLGRAPVLLDERAVGAFLAGRRVLVTGGAGSVGAELCRQIARHHRPALLVALDHGERSLYRLDARLRRQDTPHAIVLGDVRDAATVERAFARYRPHVVFHAAAYKHVPLLEENPTEAARTNVLGTAIAAQAAERHGAKAFVLISTDKAVRPSSVLGATKRAAELYCMALGRESSTRFVVTRFGNVLGSSGSVVPLFRRQIARGGPVTVTDPSATRYFMSPQEAGRLILQAGAIGRSGEILVLDMGEPVPIRTLAEKMIRLAGCEPGREVPIVYTGLRAGEKLSESLVYERETLRPTAYRKLLRVETPAPPALDWLRARLARLEQALPESDAAVIAALQRLVPEFQPRRPRAPAGAASGAKAPNPVVPLRPLS
jgi:FlaA1/EpsC-like NDP-sugar epimerase